MKPELIFVSPKTSEAKEVFQYDMDKLHTCKVKERKNGMIQLSSISGRFVFWMDENNEAKAMNAEVAMMLVCPWVAYLISEGLGLSGIVAILTNGVVL